MSPPAPEIPDLLADSVPEIQTTPIEPVPSASQAILPTNVEKANPPPDAAASTVDDASPDVTIRLVGGGGMSGPAAPEPEEETAADSDVGSVKSESVTGSDAPANDGEKKHKKTKSGLAGLKKSLGGLRKKDSVSSAKDIIPDAN